MSRLARKLLVAGLLGFIALIAGGCASVTPVEGVPIAVEIPNQSAFTVRHTYAYHYRDTLVVEGTLSLYRSVVFSQNAHFDVRIFDAKGQILAQAPARIERDEPHRPHDPRPGASFKARFQVPLSQVARIEAVFSREPKA